MLGTARSIVRVGPDGSASVVINTNGTIYNGSGSGGGGGNTIKRKFNNGKSSGVAADLSRSIADLRSSQNCAKCDGKEEKLFHGLKCNRNNNNNNVSEVARLRKELNAMTSDLERARQQIVNLQVERESYER